ncbi:MAG: sulfite exporter TauE/SafE family protein, partial [Duodenibacillus sp.]|nr:sulfite exporter TauE/SafE family protein [Duodenibacillus sp.]
TFAGAGTIYPALAVPLALASIAGNRLGARYAIKVGPKLVRTLLYGVLTLLFMTLVYRYFIAP